MENNINFDDGFANMSSEDRIRHLMSNGTDQSGAKVANDVFEFRQMNGVNNQVNPYQLGQFLMSRGHKVNYTQ
jgi:hypothetical protein